MGELELIVQRMRDAGESEESIAGVIKFYESKKVTDPAKKVASAGSKNKATQSYEDTVSKLETGFSAFRKKNIKKEPEYPTQAIDILPAFKSTEERFQNLQATKEWYNSEEGKEFRQRGVNYRNSVRAKLRNNGAYKLGLEGNSISELQEKGLKDALVNPVNELHFGMYGNSRPDTYYRDKIIEEEIEKAKNDETKQLRDLELKTQAEYKAAGNYENILKTGAAQFKSEMTPEQIQYNELRDQAKEIRNKISKSDDVVKIREYQTQLFDLDKKAKNLEEKALQGKTPLLDAITGQPLGTIEATEMPEEGVIDTRSEIEKLKSQYKSRTQEELDRILFTHTLDYESLNEELESTIDISTNKEYFGIQEGSILGERLTELGYEMESSDWTNEYANIGSFKNVKIKDLLAFRKNDAVMSSIQKSLDQQREGKGPVFTEKIKDKLNNLAQESIDLKIQREAIKETHILNISPSSETPGFVGGLQSFGKEAAKSIGKIVGIDKEIADLLPSTRMEELDEINKLFNSGDITVSEENKEAFNRSFGMQFAEGMGGFVGDLIQFALLNKAAGAAGITARIAQISNESKVRGTILKLLQEEFNFQVVTRGEAPLGEGVFFGLGSMGAGKLIPKIKNSKFSALNSIISKTVTPGVGMAAGSETAALVHALNDDLLGKQDIKTSLKEQYGSLDETGMRIALNLAMGSTLAVKSVKRKDFSSMASRRKLLQETIIDLRDGKFEGNEEFKKQQLVAELQADIALADENFNKLSIGEQNENKKEAQKILETREVFDLKIGSKREATAQELKEAKRTIDSYEVNRLLAEKSINKSFENLMRSGIVKDAKLIITDDSSLLDPGNKGQFEKDTNTIKINISQYKPGVFEQEAGHLFMKAAFEGNVKVAEAFKSKIQNEVAELLKNEKFNVGNKKDLSFEEAINEAYKKKQNDIPEEYIMNLVEFLSSPRYRDLLLKKGLLNSLKQETLNTANKIGFDYTNKNNFKTGADLLEFLFSIGKTIEGGSSQAIKNKFEAFKNLVIDGNKLLDLTTGKKVTDPKEAENVMASAKIEESEKKDVFSKANKIYEEYKDDPTSAALMVGLEFEPIVKKMLNKYRDLFGMDEYTLDLIASDVMIETRPGYNGIPALVKTWDPTKGASLTSHIYGNLPNRILGIIQNKYPELGRTVELNVEKADKLTTDEGFGGSGFVNDGFVDISSPEAYTRVSRKKAEVTMGMPPEYAQRAEEIGARILMANKLQDLDAKIVGTIKDSEGRTLRVAMLESDKARVYLPDGTTEIIKARTPKVIEQKYGAPDSSFKKIATTKTQMIEDAKAYLIPEMEKAAGGLKDNYEPTPQYTEFIDKTFSLYKDYLSQSAINKRFADFAEPVMDPKTGKQAREKTAQGKKIFTKKPLTLAEWRKYFIGDGTKRIDGRRRSLLEALATEQGFDKVMEVLSKEEMRKQIESRQEDLSVNLVENYVAIIAKSLDRNNPNVMAAKVIEEANKQNINLKELLIKPDGTYLSYKELSSTEEGRSIIEITEDIVRYDLSLQIKLVEELKKINKTTLEKLILRGVDAEMVKDINSVQNSSKSQIDNYEKNLKYIVSFLPKEMIDFTSSGSSKLKANALASLLGYTSRRPKGDLSKLMNRELFLESYENILGTKYSELSKETQDLWKEVIEIAKSNNTKGAGISIGYKAKKFISDIINIQNSNLSPSEKERRIKQLPNKNEAIKDNILKTKTLEALLNTFSEKSLELEGKDLKNFIDTVSRMLMNNDGAGIRNYSAELYIEVGEGDFTKTKNEHSLSKAEFAADVIQGLINKTLDPIKIKKLVEEFKSVRGSKKGQKISDLLMGSTIENAAVLKMIASRILNKELKSADVLQLKNFFNYATEKNAYEEIIEAYVNEAANSLLKADPNINKGINSQLGIIKANITGYTLEKAIEADNIIRQNNILASKQINLAEETANMIERRTGISAKAPLSASKAANIGKTKGKFNFYLPPNAEDFAGLLYKLYGKGEQGNKDMAFMKEHLLDPYNAGEQAISTYKQNLAEDYKSIEKQLGQIEGTVSKETKATLEELGFNADQAVRVALWNQAGFEIPGIQNIEAAKLRIAVIKDKRLKAYADGIRTIVKGNLFEPSEQWFSSNIRYDLFTHATEGVRSKFLEQWDTNVKEIFTKENLTKLEAAYGKGYVNNLQDMIDRMRTGKSRGANLGKEANAVLDYINGSIGVIMWMNTRSAILQTISAVNYINWGDNNPVRIAQTLAKPKEFASTFMEIFNSDFLKQRRSGLEINVEEAEIARAVEKSKGKASAIFNALIKAGFKPTQIADSFAIAIGGAPLLINRTKTYQRKGFEYAEAREKAFNDLREISEENQQSSRQDKVSNIQVGVLGRLIFAFNNTPFQMTRLQKKSALDIINRRGDLKTNISKLAYYSVIQSVIFYALQQGAALTLFGKDDEDLTESEKEKIANYKDKKSIQLTNSVVDAFLSGSGLPGKVLITGKNTLSKYFEEEVKGYKADYGDVLNEAFSISPPISSKTKKAYSAFKTFRRGSTKKGKFEFEQYNKFSPLHPLNVARAKMFSAVTNVPLDRTITKIDNLSEAMNNTTIEPQIRLALALGWDKWSLGFYDDLYGENKKPVTKEIKESSSVRKETNRKKALDFANKSFKYRDSVRLANYRNKK